MMNNPDLIIDFASNANHYRRLHGGGRGQPIARAIGLKTYGLPLNVIDATTGLGNDSFVLASLGCNVHMIERSPVIYQLLESALQNGLNDLSIAEIIARMHLHNGDAIHIMSQIAKDNSIDVVYLDPMFPERTKSALVKKEMRILKELVGDDIDADQLLNVARNVAKRRIVVKRPRSAPYLNNVKPHSEQIGKANRFDIYMPL